MAAMIETMAYAGEVPWHGLGNQVSADVSVDEMTIQAGLDWTVSKRPVRYGLSEFDPAANRIFKDRYVLARDTDDKAMSVVSGRYKAVQPKEIMEFFRELVALGNFRLETAGSLSDGKRIWALADTGDAAKILRQDEVKSYLMLATSYDGTFATLAQFTDIRVVCNNTLQAALKDYRTRISIPHIREFDAQSVKEQLGIHADAWNARVQAMELLAKTKVDIEKASNVIRAVFNVPKELTSKEAILANNHADNVIQLFAGRGIGSDLEAANGTAWGVLNSVTEYVDHTKRARGADGRLNSAWFGEGARTKQTAWDEVMALAA